MKVFVTGVAGQLGHDVMNELAKRGYEGIGTDIAPEYSGVADGTAVVSMPYVSLDITDADAVDRVICEMKPDVVVHCAAWTAVDLAEDEDKKDKVHAINADGTANIAKACKKTGSKMVYISTDYVFDGQGLLHGHQIARIISHLMFMVSLSLTVSLLFLVLLTTTLSCVSHGYLARTERTLSRQC